MFRGIYLYARVADLASRAKMLLRPDPLAPRKGEPKIRAKNWSAPSSTKNSKNAAQLLVPENTD